MIGNGSGITQHAWLQKHRYKDCTLYHLHHSAGMGLMLHSDTSSLLTGRTGVSTGQQFLTGQSSKTKKCFFVHRNET